MDELIDQMESVIMAEKARAKALHGSAYASMHEANGVLMEEIQEGWYEARRLTSLQSDLTYAIRVDNPDVIKKIALEVAKVATLASCEYAQVAAVCYKLVDGMEG